MRRSTVTYLLLLFLMAGVYYYLNHRAKPADAQPTGTPEAPISFLFTSDNGEPASIHIESKSGEIVELKRNFEKVWVMVLPIEASADQGSVEAAASQVTAMQITDRLPNINPKDVGLDTPAYKLIVKFANGVERIAEIGVITPTTNGYYVRADQKVVIVSKSSIDALIGLLTNPPYAETLTPSPTTTTPLPSTPKAGTATTETATPKP